MNADSITLKAPQIILILAFYGEFLLVFFRLYVLKVRKFWILMLLIARLKTKTLLYFWVAF